MPVPVRMSWLSGQAVLDAAGRVGGVIRNPQLVRQIVRIDGSASPAGRVISSSVRFVATRRPRRSYQGRLPIRSMAWTGPPAGPPAVVLRKARHGLAPAPGIDGSAIVAQILSAPRRPAPSPVSPKREVAAEAVGLLREVLHRLEAGDEEAERRQRRRVRARVEAGVRARVEAASVSTSRPASVSASRLVSAGSASDGSGPASPSPSPSSRASSPGAGVSPPAPPEPPASGPCDALDPQAIEAESARPTSAAASPLRHRALLRSSPAPLILPIESSSPPPARRQSKSPGNTGATGPRPRFSPPVIWPIIMAIA